MLAALVAPTAAAWGQLELSELRGRVLDPGGGEAQNVTDAAYAFNFGNPFSGTHFGPPRTFALKVRLGSIE